MEDNITKFSSKENAKIFLKENDEISKKISWFSNNLKHFIKGENLISTVDFELGF